ncbi:MAG: GntR family transcriptional regulator [Anaerolineales bacterium]|nr:GntR family transcriptional regulator [Rhodocyclaceae bacterium]MCW5886669.1 GntR family transcriptional regulator [Anaerolineales bacterium]
MLAMKSAIAGIGVAPNSSLATRDAKRSADGLDRLRGALERLSMSDEPRHSRLCRAMLTLMADGHWLPGDKLPPEKEIADAVGLSLGTVQKTLARLAADNVVQRKHGHGTFVSSSSQSEQLLHFRFIGNDGSALMPVYAEALDCTAVPADGPWAGFLTGARKFIRVRRRINVSDEFDCLSELFIDGERFRAILAMPLKELNHVLIRTVLAERFNAPTLSVSQQIFATDFTPEIGKLLKLPAKERFGMVLEVRSYTHQQAPLAFQQIYIPGNVRHLELPSRKVMHT